MQFMIRVELPSPSAYPSGPSGDTEYYTAYKDAIFASLPDGFEVFWPRAGQRWPVDSEGYTFVPLYLGDESRVERPMRLLHRMDEMYKEITALRAWIKAAPQ